MFSFSGFDVDALAFLNATAITDVTIMNAINTFVVGLKSNSLWAKMRYIYPLVGGTATTHKFNLKNTLLHEITFSGALTHDVNGITFGGGTINTNCAGDLEGLNSAHVSVYSRTAGNSPGAEVTYAGIPTNPRMMLIIQYTNGNTYNSYNNTYNTSFANLAAVSTGLYLMNRETSTALNLYRRGSNVWARTLATTLTTSTNIAMGAFSGVGYSIRNTCFYSHGSHLTPSEVTIFDTLVQTLQTSLSRNIY